MDTTHFGPDGPAAPCGPIRPPGRSGQNPSSLGYSFIDFKVTPKFDSFLDEDGNSEPVSGSDFVQASQVQDNGDPPLVLPNKKKAKKKPVSG